MQSLSLRRIPVFFYGLFMDVELVRAKGAAPTDVQHASVAGFALRIGQRATLIADAEATSYGILMWLTHQEIDRLYADASVQAYRPEAILARRADGTHVPALCFTLVELPSLSEANPDYAAKLRDLGRRLRLPTPYVEQIR
jgi:hypothetical protein